MNLDDEDDEYDVVIETLQEKIDKLWELNQGNEQWGNGEGFDIVIERKGSTEKFSLTYGEWSLLQVLMNWKDDKE